MPNRVHHLPAELAAAFQTGRVELVKLFTASVKQGRVITIEEQLGILGMVEDMFSAYTTTMTLLENAFYEVKVAGDKLLKTRSDLDAVGKLISVLKTRLETAKNPPEEG